MNKRKPHICFVAPTAWSVLSGDRSIKSVGGAEAQQCLLARTFVNRGYRVSMICMDYGQPEGVEIDGVRVLKAHTPQGGLPVIRFLHPRLTSVWSAMKRSNADIYYQRCCGVATGYVAAFCRVYGRKFVYVAAHDDDFDPKCSVIHYRRDKAIYVWGLRHADVIVTQNPIQAKQCREVYNRESVLVQSCYTPSRNYQADPHGYVLWVATVRKWKQPEVFIELARRLPQYRFRMVGGADDQKYFTVLRSMATKVPNLEFVGFVPHIDIEREFNGARLFINTSKFEGFPNTFLQSWARGIPTVSFVDTGSALNGHPVLNRVITLDDMTSTVQNLMEDSAAWRAAGTRCAACYANQHSTQVAADNYEAIFEKLLATDR